MGELTGGSDGKADLQQKLLEEKQRFQSLFYNTSEAVIALDTEGLITDVNGSFENKFGYELREIKGRDIDDVLARFGGDEFVILLSASDEEDVSELYSRSKKNKMVEGLLNALGVKSNENKITPCG